MITFIHALILLLAIEGALFALFPDLMRRAMLEMIMQSDASIRSIGVVALVIAIIAGLLLRCFG